MNHSPAPRRVLVVDDSPLIRALERRTLEVEGFEVREVATALGVEEEIAAFSPDVVVSDIMMPGRNGIDLCRALQANPNTASLPVILASAKDFDADKRAALEAGASFYLVKPFAPEALVRAVRQVLNRHLGVTIWGCRGSIAAPDRAWGSYGGNTSCIDIVLPGQRHFIFDAGTGIRALGNDLLAQSPLRLALFLTHFHWDHTQGLPFFKPLYVPGNEIHIFGPEDRAVSMSQTLASVMGGKFFPVSIEAFRALVRYNSLQEQVDPIDVFGVSISMLEALHPGTTLAYKLEFDGRSVVYCPDNELVPATCFPALDGEALRMAEFARGASVFIHDCQFTRPVYEQRKGWGHSCGECLAAVVAHARPQRTLLFHHDPDHSDAQVEEIHGEFQAALGALGIQFWSECAREGTTLLL
jgi:phosphoribosyl 1,2-cyclic phosphodiesterase/CheY-like chemotaxis protein